MITLTLKCGNCSWGRIATTSKTSALSIDEIMRQAQTHTNKEDHKINGIMRIEPGDE